MVILLLNIVSFCVYIITGILVINIDGNLYPPVVWYSGNIWWVRAVLWPVIILIMVYKALKKLLT